MPSWNSFINWIKCSFGHHKIHRDDLLRLDGADESRLPIITNCVICRAKLALRHHPTASWMYTIEEI